MNSQVSKIIHGKTVDARPVFKGGQVPAYWAAIVDQRTLPKTFSSPTAVFQFVTHRHNTNLSL